jgi:hypothetical protein
MLSAGMLSAGMLSAGMLSAGKLVSERPRYVAIRNGVLNHMAHHRGQLTVYLRLNEEKVPAIYVRSADEGKG